VSLLWISLALISPFHTNWYITAVYDFSFASAFPYI